MLAHGARPVECCKTIFAAQNNNVDSEMNAGTQHRLIRHSIASPRRGYANMPPRTKTPSTQVPAKIGRPTKYSPEWAEGFCALIAEGQSVAEICAGPDMPSQQSVYTWLKQDEDFLERYTRAREAQADKLAKEILELSDKIEDDNPVKVQRARL